MFLLCCQSQCPNGQRCSPWQVAWIKSDTKAILAIHDHVLLHSDTGKITVTHNDRNTWTLRIRVVDERDAGWYQCQINSEPILQQAST